MGMNKEELNRKIAFVKALSPVAAMAHTGVEEMIYNVYVSPKGDDYEEFLIVIYEGGSSDIRCCTGNSEYAIFEEAARLLTYKGNYADRRRLENLVQDGWTRMK